MDIVGLLENNHGYDHVFRMDVSVPDVLDVRHVGLFVIASSIVECGTCSWKGVKDNLNSPKRSIDHSNGLLEFYEFEPRCPICNSDNITNAYNRNIWNGYELWD